MAIYKSLNTFNTGGEVDTLGDTSYLFPQRGFLAGMGDISTDLSNLSLTDITTGLMQLWQTNQQMDLLSQVNQINLARAQKGLDPIAFDTTSASPTVKVVASPDSATKNMLMMAGLFLAGFFIFKEMRKK